MRTNKLVVEIRAAAGALLLAAMLAGCAKPAPVPVAEPPAAPPSAAPAMPEATPPADSAPAPDAPAPTEPSPAPEPAAANEPSLESMHTATPSAKIGVAVTLRYTFDGEPTLNQPVILHLAAVPRVAATNLKVSVKQVEGLQLAAGPLTAQKAGGSDVYRQQISVTPLATAPSQLRVLVTMDMGADSAFGFYSIPLSGQTAVKKQDSVKQR